MRIINSTEFATGEHAHTDVDATLVFPNLGTDTNMHHPLALDQMYGPKTLRAGRPYEFSAFYYFGAWLDQVFGRPYILIAQVCSTLLGQRRSSADSVDLMDLGGSHWDGNQTSLDQRVGGSSPSEFATATPVFAAARCGEGVALRRWWREIGRAHV